MLPAAILNATHIHDKHSGPWMLCHILARSCTAYCVKLAPSFSLSVVEAAAQGRTMCTTQNYEFRIGVPIKSNIFVSAEPQQEAYSGIALHFPVSWDRARALTRRLRQRCWSWTGCGRRDEEVESKRLKAEVEVAELETMNAKDWRGTHYSTAFSRFTFNSCIPRDLTHQT
jgi:hypothetical protein